MYILAGIQQLDQNNFLLIVTVAVYITVAGYLSKEAEHTVRRRW